MVTIWDRMVIAIRITTCAETYFITTIPKQCRKIITFSRWTATSWWIVSRRRATASSWPSAIPLWKWRGRCTAASSLTTSTRSCRSSLAITSTARWRFAVRRMATMIIGRWADVPFMALAVRETATWNGFGTMMTGRAPRKFNIQGTRRHRRIRWISTWVTRFITSFPTATIRSLRTTTSRRSWRTTRIRTRWRAARLRSPTNSNCRTITRSSRNPKRLRRPFPELWSWRRKRLSRRSRYFQECWPRWSSSTTTHAGGRLGRGSSAGKTRELEDSLGWGDWLTRTKVKLKRSFELWLKDFFQLPGRFLTAALVRSSLTVTCWRPGTASPI